MGFQHLEHQCSARKLSLEQFEEGGLNAVEKRPPAVIISIITTIIIIIAIIIIIIIAINTK